MLASTEKLQADLQRGNRARELKDSAAWGEHILPDLERRLKSYVDSLRLTLGHDDYLKVLGKIEELEHLVNLPDTFARSGANAAEALAKQDA